MEKLRNEISDEYKWDLKKLIKDKDEWESSLKKLDSLADKIKSFENHIYDDENKLYEFLEFNDEFNILLEKVYLYAHLFFSEDMSNNEAIKLNMLVESKMEKYNTMLSFIATELMSKSYDEFLSLTKKNKKLDKYKFYMEKTFRYQKFTLSKEEEKIIAEASNTLSTPEDVFDNIDNVDVKFDEILDESGNKVTLTNANYSLFIRSYDRNVRKNAFDALYKYYKGLINTIAANYKGLIKNEFFISKIRTFDSPLDYSLYSDNFDRKIYDNLINVVHKNLDVFYKYVDIKKRLLNLDEMHLYDMYVNVSNISKTFPFEDGKSLLFDALKPLGEEYLNNLKKAFSDKWIDIYPNRSKKSGAYEINAYRVDPYVSVNYVDNFDSVSTLAHELGHAMHSYYSDSNQEYVYCHYPIYLAEIASTVNEMLLKEYMYKNAKTNEEKISYLTSILEIIRTTIFRQTMFAEFESVIFDKYQKQIPITKDELCNTYYELNKLYFGDKVVCDSDIQYEWARIPHFYTPFYVYKYATSLCASIYIVKKILEGNSNIRENYLNFLKSGCSKYPNDTLKLIGIDAFDTKYLEEAMDYFKELVNELDELTKEV